MAPFAPYCLAAVFGLVGLFPLFNFRASLKPTNWLFAATSAASSSSTGLRNWRLPADSLQIVGLEYGEIAWAKLVKERRTTPCNDGKHSSQTTWLTYIDLRLVHPDTSKLEASLEAERRLRPNGVMVSLDYPVQVLPGGIVEVRWGAGIRPSAKKPSSGWASA